MALSKDQILASDDREVRSVDVPEWGGEIRLRAMSGTDRNAYDQSLITVNGDQVTPNLVNIHAKLLARCIVDDDGELMFEPGGQDLLALGAKSAGVLARLVRLAEEMNGLGQRAADEAKGNSEAAPTDSSTSA